MLSMITLVSEFRIRKGFPCEARVVARILPQFLDDFFPPQDVMNKVIGEFLSNQQPYPQFMATVVYKVGFELLLSKTSSVINSAIILLWANMYIMCILYSCIITIQNMMGYPTKHATMCACHIRAKILSQDMNLSQTFKAEWLDLSKGK